MRWRSVVLASLLCAGAAGCDSCLGRGETAASPSEPEVEGTASVDPELTLGLPAGVAQRVLAVVDGEELRVLDVARELERGGPTAAARMSDARARRQLVEVLVRDRALAVEARRRGLADDPRVAVARDEVLARALVEQLTADVAPPSEAEVRAYYDAHRDDYRDPPLASVGLLFTRERARAEAALAEMIADRHHRLEIWVRTAEAIGFAGPRRQPIEDTEPFAATPRPGESFVPQVIRDLAFEGTPGDMHPELVPFEDGFYIVRFDRQIPATDVPFEQVRDSIAAQLQAAAVDARIEEIVRTALSTATYDEEALTTVRVPE
jgi:peptidyl-prolyl cis-trans isomerase C